MSVQWRDTSKKPMRGCFTDNSGERLNGIQEVSGSIPLISTKQKDTLRRVFLFGAYPAAASFESASEWRAGI